jgi:peptidoglycan DL-endopeptidase CwlO
MRACATRAYRTATIALSVTLFGATAVFSVPASTLAATQPVTKVAAQTAPSAIVTPVTPRSDAFRADLQSRQTSMTALVTQLDNLDIQAEIAAESYNQAQQSLTEAQARLSASQANLSAAQAALDQQTSLLASRVDSMYRDGDTTNVEVLLSSTSIADFLSRAQSIATISQADAGVALELASQRDQIQTQQVDLQKAETDAESLEFSLKARKLEIEYQIADRQKMLQAAQRDLVGTLDTEAKRRTAEEMGLWHSILGGAKDIGVTVQPGSPVETALSYHGIPYVWGGASPSGFDCSGLTMYVMKQHGVVLPHHAASQYLMGAHVDPSSLQPGDLVFFGSPVHHVGMCIGGGYFVEAPHTGDFVKVSKLAGRSDLVGARRYPWRFRIGPPLGVGHVSTPGNLPK